MFFKKKIKKEELVKKLFSIGYKRYDEIVNYFKLNNIEFDNILLFINVQSINIKIFELLIKDNNNEYYSLSIKNLICSQLSDDKMDRKEFENKINNYINSSMNTIDELIGEGNNKISDLAIYLLEEVCSEVADNKIVVDLVNIFTIWKEELNIFLKDFIII